MLKRLSDPVISELSLIFAEHKGEKWAPRNPSALVLATKGAPAAAGKTTFDRLAERIGADKAAALKGLWVKDGTPDGVDHDDDGAEDYEQILGILFGSLGTPPGSPGYYDYAWSSYSASGGLVGDLQRAMQIQDIDMRSAAIASGIDTFLEQLDDVRSGGDGAKKAAIVAARKAGARHSAADMAHINAISDAAKKAADGAKAMSDAAQAITEHTTALTATSPTADDGIGEDDSEKAKALVAKAVPSEPGDDGRPTAYLIDGTAYLPATFAAIARKASSSDDAPYGDVDYADPGYQDDKKKRYPLDTAAHVRAAASYFGMEKNRSKYTAEQQKAIDAKIAAAKKKFDIGDSSDSNDSKGAPIEQLLDAIKPLFEAQKASFTQALADQATAFDAKLDAKTTEISDAAKAGSEKADKLKASIDLMVGAARQPSAPGGDAQLEQDGTIKAAPGTTADEIPAPAIPPGTSFDEGFKAIQENAKKARGRTRRAAP